MKKLLFNLLLASIITFLFIFVEQAYRIYNDILVFNLNFKTLLEQLLINFLIISILNRKAIFIVYIILSLLVWFQIVHFAYFGTWIFPLEYYLFFTKFKETYDTFRTITEIAIVPTIMIVILIISIYYLLKYSEDRRLKIPYLSFILIAFLIFLPIRVYVKDSKKGNRTSVEYYTLKNTFTTLGYLLGNIIPKKISGHSGLEQPITPTPELISKNPDINIIMIMGESLHRDYMSLYGYNVNTTPFLNSLKNKENFIYKKGISSGVVTDVGIPSFFNIIKRPDGVPQIISTNTCLFKMAKNNGFETYFYSAQAQGQLAQLKSYICTKWIDKYEDGTTIAKEIDTPTRDEFLIDKIDSVSFEKPTFLTLHYRSAHSPFKETYPKEFEVFTKENSNKDTLQNTIEYQNAVYYIDYILSQIVKKIEMKTKRPTFFILTSDHATNLGDKDRNGHGRLDYDSVYQVPFFVYGINNTKNLKDKFSDFPYISHYQMGKVVSYLLGYKQELQYFNKKEDYFVCDSDISGLSGVLKLSFDKDNNQIPTLIE
ncbi:phosphoethanolamine transferase [Malaciobacter mytili]|uniref:phosphoethanolamine transferase n=1 Tax=Malaciobacter mytili TaxID=603050 RepID=UPI003A845D9D